MVAFLALFLASNWVVQENLERRAELWAPELNELGAPFYLSDHEGALLGVETFIGTYPEILSVTWYQTDGSVFESVNQDGPVADASTVALDEPLALR